VLAALVLVVGDEQLLIDRAVDERLQSARAADPDVEVHRMEAAGLTPAVLIDVFSPSLFGGGRFVVVRDSHELPKDVADVLAGYLSVDDPDCSLMLTHAGGAKGKPLLDRVRKAGAEQIACAAIKRPSERLAFVLAEARGVGASMSEEAGQLVVDTVGADLRELAAAVSQLAADSADGITADAVRRYHRGRADVTGFTVADAAVTGDCGGALESLRWALSLGVDPVPIADAIADGVRTVAKVASAGRAPGAALAAELRMPPWKVDRARRQSRGWSERGLSRATRLVAGLNADVKGNARDTTYALERAIFGLAEARGLR